MRLAIRAGLLSNDHAAQLAAASRLTTLAAIDPTLAAAIPPDESARATALVDVADLPLDDARKVEVAEQKLAAQQETQPPAPASDDGLATPTPEDGAGNDGSEDDVLSDEFELAQGRGRALLSRTARGLTRASRAMGNARRALVRRYPAGKVIRATKESLTRYIDESRKYRSAMAERFTELGFTENAKEVSTERRLQRLPVSRFDLGDLSPEMVNEAAQYVPAFGKLNSNNLSVTSKILTKVDRSNAERTEPGVRALLRIAEQGAEVLPNPSHADRVLFVQNGGDDRMVSVVEVRANSRGVEVVTYIPRMRADNSLIVRARELKRTFGVNER